LAGLPLRFDLPPGRYEALQGDRPCPVTVVESPDGVTLWALVDIPANGRTRVTVTPQ
jgi:hypothetical protein